MKKRRKNGEKTPMEAAMELTDLRSEGADPLGSYTGTPADPAERPVQDADDL